MKLDKQAVLFDLDGTLVDNRASFQKAYRALCAAYPDLLSPDDRRAEQLMTEFYRMSLMRESYEALCRRTACALPPMEAFHDAWCRIYAENAVPFPWSTDTLDYLRTGGYRIGLVTNGDAFRQWTKIRSSGLAPMFDHIVVSGDQPFEKPDPQIYALALSGLGVAAEHALFVGDTVGTDIEGAKRAGIDSLWLTEQPTNSVGATYIARDVSFLKTIL